MNRANAEEKEIMLEKYTELQSQNEKKCIYQNGDKIKVIKGDYVNLTGVIVNVLAKEYSVAFKPDDIQLWNQEITLGMSNIIKHFEIG